MTRRTLRMTAKQPWVIILFVAAGLPTLVGVVGMLYKVADLAVKRSQYQPEQLAKAVELGLVSADPVSMVLSIQVTWYWVAPLLAMMMALFAGAGVVADDMRMGTFQFYFARPLSRDQYLIGKLVAIFLLVWFVTLGPSLILMLLRLALINREYDSLGKFLLMPLWVILLATLRAAVLTIPAVALSSLSKRRGLVQGGYAGLYLVPWVLGLILSNLLRSPWPLIISIPSQLEAVGTRLFGMPASNTMLPWLPALCVMAALIVGSILLLRARLAAVEVVAGS